MMKRISKQNDKYKSCCWRTLPDEVMEMILKRLNLSDRIRCLIVCKSWMSIAMREDNRAPSRMPWLVLPQASNSGNYLSVSSISEGKVVNFKLPKPVHADWCIGSSKGWLIMENKGQITQSEIILVNPISGAQHKLPPLTTIPSLLNIYADQGYLIQAIELSSPNISECLVAALFYRSKELGLCRPGGKSWTVFQISDFIDQNVIAQKLLFSSSGMLLALVNHDDHTKNGIVAAPHTLNFGDDDDHDCAVELRFVYDIIEEEEAQFKHYDGYFISQIGDYRSYLLESITTSDNEFLLVHQIYDIFEIDYDDLHESTEFEFWRTSGFVVYKIDLKNGNNFIKVQSLGNQILLLSEDGSSFSFLPNDFEGLDLEGNCIYFATTGFKLNSPYLMDVRNISREIGVFYLNDEKIKRFFPSIEYDGASQRGLSWLLWVLNLVGYDGKSPERGLRWLVNLIGYDGPSPLTRLCWLLNLLDPSLQNSLNRLLNLFENVGASPQRVLSWFSPYV